MVTLDGALLLNAAEVASDGNSVISWWLFIFHAIHSFTQWLALYAVAN